MPLSCGACQFSSFVVDRRPMKNLILVSLDGATIRGHQRGCSGAVADHKKRWSAPRGVAANHQVCGEGAVLRDCTFSKRFSVSIDLRKRD